MGKRRNIYLNDRDWSDLAYIQKYLVEHKLPMRGKSTVIHYLIGRMLKVIDDEPIPPRKVHRD